jgi:hypothetical protein
MTEEAYAWVFYGSLAFAAVSYRVYREYWFNPNRASVRAMARISRRSIASVSEGETVRIVGTLECAESRLTAPLTGRSCVAYQVIYAIEEAGLGLRKRRTETTARQFFIRDDTGLVHVCIETPTLAPLRDRHWSFGQILGAPELFERYLARHRLSRRRFLFKRRAEFFEGILEKGQRVAVTGVARWDVDAQDAVTNYREAPRRLTIDATDTVPVMVSNDPRAMR